MSQPVLNPELRKHLITSANAREVIHHPFMVESYIPEWTERYNETFDKKLAWASKAIEEGNYELLVMLIYERAYRSHAFAEHVVPNRKLIGDKRYFRILAGLIIDSENVSQWMLSFRGWVLDEPTEMTRLMMTDEELQEF